MVLRGADGRDDALSNTRNDGRFTCTAHEAVDIRTYGDTRLDLELNAVCRNGGDDRCLDDLRVDAHLHGVKHVASRKVDGRRTLKGQIDLRAV